jgi:hypothetical protein
VGEHPAVARLAHRAAQQETALTLYHVTTKDAAAAIQRDGFVDGKPELLGGI